MIDAMLEITSLDLRVARTRYAFARAMFHNIRN